MDKSPYKQNKFLPGSNIPIYQNEIIKSSKPDYIIILLWNLKDEISQQLNYIRGWDGKFVCAIPNFEIFKIKNTNYKAFNFKFRNKLRE